MKKVEAVMQEWLNKVGSPDTQCCARCKHFWLHWVYVDDTMFRTKGFRPCYAGHCVYPRHKPRRPHDYCDHFEKRETNTEEM